MASTKLRSACDRCHENKVRCSGATPCQGCLSAKTLCFYSFSGPLGRPRGAQNRKSQASFAVQQSQQDSNALNESNRSSSSASLVKSRRSSKQQAKRTARASSQGNASVARNISQEEVQWSSNDAVDSDILAVHSSDITIDTQIPAIDGGPMQIDLPPSPDLSTPTEPTMSLPLMTSIDADFNSMWSTFPTPNRSSMDWDSIGHDLNTSCSPPWNAAMPVQPTIRPLALTNTAPAISIPTSTADASQAMLNGIRHSSIDVPPAQLATPVSTINHNSRASFDGTQSTFCTCLRQHTELVSSQQILESLCGDDNDANLSLDTALSLVRQQTEAWQNLVFCPQCPYQRDQAVMRLALVAIRASTRYLERLAPRYSVKQDELAARPPTSSATTNAPQRNLTQQPFDIPASTNDKTETTRLLIGRLEIDGEERMLVYRVLFKQALCKIKTILQSLGSMQEQRKAQLLQDTTGRAAKLEEYEASNNLSHMQQMSRMLAAAIHSLEKAFETNS